MKNSKLITAILVALALGLIGNGLVSWRTIGVLENDMRHLESLIVDTREEGRKERRELRQGVRDLHRFFRLIPDD